MFLVACPPILANATSAVQVLDNRREEIGIFIRDLLVVQSEHCLLCLVKLAIAVKLAMDRHRNEVEDLRVKTAQLDSMIHTLFRCRSMYLLDNVRRVLLPAATVRVVPTAASASDRLASTSTAGLDPDRESPAVGSMSFTEENLPYIETAHMLDDEEVLGLCRMYAVKSVFSSSHVSVWMFNLFWGNVVVSSR